MNRFVIVDGIPYLSSNGKTYAVRWDDNGFTVGAEVNLTSVPAVTHSELSVMAKCSCLDSIRASVKKTETGNALEDMSVEELKAYAAERGIDIGNKRAKSSIIAAIEGETK